MRCIVLSVAVAVLLCLAAGHTWVEQAIQLAGNGAFIGAPGFPRGNVLRSSPTFSDPLMQHLLGPTIGPTDPMCRTSQQNQVQTDGSPRLQAPAGSFIALEYQENGHVTLPENQKGKPDNRGTVFIYGTSKPHPNENFADVHKVWNADGTGGDGRGRLLATQNYDDGQCYQVNDGLISTARRQQFHKTKVEPPQGENLWCQNDIALPQDLPVGQPYTLYWVWDWPTLPGKDPNLPQGKTEIYTTCMDIDIIAGEPSQKGVVSANCDIGDCAVPSLFQSLLTSDNSQQPQTQPTATPTNGGDQPAPTENSNGVHTVTVTQTVYIPPSPKPGRRAVEFSG